MSEALIERFKRYVSIDSETFEEGPFNEVLIRELREMGFDVVEDEAGQQIGSDANNIIAYKKGSISGEPIALSCHTDTVKPGRGIAVIELEDRLISDGKTILGADDKAGVAAVMEAVSQLHSERAAHRDIEIIFSVSEEAGLMGSKYMDYRLIKSQNIVVLDSGGDIGGIVTKAPGKVKISADFTGKAAHAGIEPEKGISAIQMASDAVSKMKLLRVDEETTSNIGSFMASNSTNIVTPHAHLIMEARSLDSDKLKAQTAHLIDCMKDSAKRFGGSVVVDVETLYEPFSIDPNCVFLNEIVQKMENLGIKTTLKSTGGGSDANHFNLSGKCAINIAIGMRGAHTLSEYLLKKDLIELCEIVRAIITS